MKKKNLKLSDVAQAIKGILEQIPSGNCDEEARKTRTASIKQLMCEGCPTVEAARELALQMVRTFEFFPSVAQVRLKMQENRRTGFEFWVGPEKPPPPTRGELLEEIRFNEEWARKYPRLANVANERIAEIQQQLAAL